MVNVASIQQIICNITSAEAASVMDFSGQISVAYPLTPHASLHELCCWAWDSNTMLLARGTALCRAGRAATSF